VQQVGAGRDTAAHDTTDRHGAVLFLPHGGALTRKSFAFGRCGLCQLGVFGGKRREKISCCRSTLIERKISVRDEYNKILFQLF